MIPGRSCVLPICAGKRSVVWYLGDPDTRLILPGISGSGSAVAPRPVCLRRIVPGTIKPHDPRDEGGAQEGQIRRIPAFAGQ
jgi:hypothetical protein